MSEYADGFDDGKGEKFDELMVEIVALRQQLAEKEDTGTTHYENCWQSGAKHYACAVKELAACAAAFDRQQEMLDRNAGQIATLREALSRLVEVHDAMGGMCSPERILAEAALAKEEGK